MSDIIEIIDGKRIRLGTGALIFNARRDLLVGDRLRNRTSCCPPEWQLPQGGLDAGLSPRENALKEIYEELGVQPAQLEFVGLTPTETLYHLPDAWLKPTPEREAARFDGQKHRWAVFSYLPDGLPDPTRVPEPEFRSVRWASPMWIVENTPLFRSAVYGIAVPEALKLLRSHTGRPALAVV